MQRCQALLDKYCSLPHTQNPIPQLVTMKYYIVLLLAACMLATTASGCAKYGCPANTEANMAKPKKKGKVQHGLVPADYAKKRGITGKSHK